MSTLAVKLMVISKENIYRRVAEAEGKIACTKGFNSEQIKRKILVLFSIPSEHYSNLLFYACK